MEKKNNPKVGKNKLNESPTSHLFDLDKRSKKIFRLIVNDFLKDGKPVGSRKLSIKMGEKLSAASVRNVMFDLQEAGLLRSNHTSAGRIPTDLGLRFSSGPKQNNGKVNLESFIMSREREREQFCRRRC